MSFAEVEKFLDTPVKRYSSGMYVRLAFAVAAHLEPEILMVDEVLAVGDADFQKKCLGKMQDTARSGRTVIFISHNMNAVQALCDRCILLEDGQLSRYGATSSVIADYCGADQPRDFYQRELSPGQKNPTIVRAVIIHGHNLNKHVAPAIYLDLDVWAKNVTATSIDVRLKDGLGTPVAFGSVGALTPSRPVGLQKGINRLRLRILLCCLALGEYFVSLDLTHPRCRVL